MKRPVFITQLLVFQILLGSWLSGQDYHMDFNDSTALDNKIIQIMEEEDMVGQAIHMIKNGEVWWHRNYGYADIENDIQVSDTTLFILHSISKTFTATAILQLWEEGLFELDDDINQYLPEDLRVVNPKYPDERITFRHLLTHTSGITDNAVTELRFSENIDCPVPLDSFVYEFFLPGGIYYSYGPYSDNPPGEVREYGENPVTLLAYLVEQLSQMTFEDYCQEHIFQPMGMNKTSFLLSKLDMNSIAVPYYPGKRPRPHGAAYDYPASGLRTSALQLANYLMAYSQDGTFNDNALLKGSTIDRIKTPQLQERLYAGYGGLDYYYDQGLIWQVSDGPGVLIGNLNLPVAGISLGHGGGGVGYTGIGFYQTEQDTIALVQLSNGVNDIPTFLSIQSLLWKYALLKGRTHPYDPFLSSGYLVHEGEGLYISTRVSNPENNEFEVYAVYTSTDSLTTDSLALYDDGNHHDGMENDGVWGNVIDNVSDEKEYSIDIMTNDFTKDDQVVLYDIMRFKTIGAVKYQGYKFSGSDASANPGATERIGISIENFSSNATVGNVVVDLISADTSINIQSPAREFGDIPPGETLWRNDFVFIIPGDYEIGREIPFQIDIYSNDFMIGSDTFSIPVEEETSTSTISKQEPGFGIYPNPFSDYVMIEYELKKPGKVSIEVFNSLGQLVAMPVHGFQQAGNNSILWKGCDNSGNTLGEGMYYVQLQTADAVRYIRKVIKLSE